MYTVKFKNSDTVCQSLPMTASRFQQPGKIPKAPLWCCEGQHREAVACWGWVTPARSGPARSIPGIKWVLRSLAAPAVQQRPVGISVLPSLLCALGGTSGSCMGHTGDRTPASGDGYMLYCSRTSF